MFRLVLTGEHCLLTFIAFFTQTPEYRDIFLTNVLEEVVR